MSEQDRVIHSYQERECPCALTETECDEFGRQLASEVDALDDINIERKAIAKQFADKKKEQELIVLSITKKINTRQEDRLIRCAIMHDYRRRTVEVFREDTREMIESRPMTRQEYDAAMQMPLPGEQ